MFKLFEAKRSWIKSNNPISKDDLIILLDNKKLYLPKDLEEYFITINGTNDQYDDLFFKLYSFSQFESLKEKFSDWNGIPNYQNIANTLLDFDKYFSIADYQCHLFTYAIRIYESERLNNEIIIICGDEYKIIANSFSEFIELYLKDSIKLYFED